MINASIATFLQNYFDHIFVITLDRAKERQQQVIKQLNGLSFDFFYGTDKLQLDWDQVKAEQVYDDARAKKLHRYGKGMILGAIACSLSHRALYEHIIQNKYKRVLVFEDDVVPLEKNIKQLPDCLKELPEEWELVYLGYTKHEDSTPALSLKQAFYKILSSIGLMKWNRTMIDNFLPLAYTKHLKIAGFHDCTHAYAITASAANKLIAAQTPIVFNSDSLLSYAVMNRQLNAFITEPKFFDQEHFTNEADKSFIHHL